MNQRIVVTGGNGFLGRHISRIAAERGAAVTSIGRAGAPRDVTPWEREHVNWVAADVFTPGWESCLAGAGVVIHCIATLAEDVARGATHQRMILESAQIVGRAAIGVPRFVYISAASAPPGTPASYLNAKRAAEAFLAGLPFELVVLRPSAIYGAERPESLQTKRTMETLARLPFVGRKMRAHRPLAVEVVAYAAVYAALDPGSPRLLGVDEIERHARRGSTL